jgi:hypothetical protein
MKQIQKKRKKKSKKKVGEADDESESEENNTDRPTAVDLGLDIESGGEDSDEDEDLEDALAEEPATSSTPSLVGGQPPEGYEWRKKVEKNMRRWIETDECERDFSDQHFGNPSSRKGKF